MIRLEYILSIIYSHWPEVCLCTTTKYTLEKATYPFEQLRDLNSFFKKKNLIDLEFKMQQRSPLSII
jgi:hypothetical protein